MPPQLKLYHLIGAKFKLQRLAMLGLSLVISVVCAVIICRVQVCTKYRFVLLNNLIFKRNFTILCEQNYLKFPDVLN